MTAHPWLIYLRAHRALKTFGIALAALIAIYLLGEDHTFHSWVSGGTTPLGRMLTFCIPLALLSIIAPREEKDYYGKAPAGMLLTVGCGIAAATTVLTGILVLLTHDSTGLGLLRLHVAWLALGIVSAYCFGARLMWALPLVLVFLSAAFAPDRESTWNLVQSRSNSPSLWLIAAGMCVAAGLCAALYCQGIRPRYLQR